MAHHPAPDEAVQYKYYDFIVAAFVTVMLCSNLVSAPKLVQIGGLTFGAGVVFFPLTYIVGDVLTEVYGYRRARRVLWVGFVAMAIASFNTVAVLKLPPDPGWTMRTVPPEFREQFDALPAELQWTRQRVWEEVFGNAPRIVVASLLGFLAGEFLNSYTLAKMKVLTAGRFLWARTIGSTVVGELADSFIYLHVAFLGVWDYSALRSALVLNYCLKVSVEVLMTPVTYAAVTLLKRAEGVDVFDTHDDFNPFSVET